MRIIPDLGMGEHIWLLLGHQDLQQIHRALEFEVAQVQTAAKGDAAHLVVQDEILEGREQQVPCQCAWFA